MTLYFYSSPADLNGPAQFGKPARFAAGDEHLAGNDLVQHKVLPAGVQFGKHIVQQQYGLFAPFPAHELPLGKL